MGLTSLHMHTQPASLAGTLLVLLTQVVSTLAQRNGHWTPIETKTRLASRSECGLAIGNKKLYLLGGNGPAAPVEAFDSEMVS